MKKILSVFAIAAFTSLLTFAVAKKFIYSDQVFLAETAPKDNGDIHFASYSPGSGSGGEGYTNLELAADKASKAVVHIKTEKKFASGSYSSPFGNDWFDQFFGGRGQFIRPEPQQGSGSGVIISADGYIVTNNHVVDGADEVTVVMNSKKNLKAKVVGKDAATDLAVLKVNEDHLPFLNYGNSDEVRLGQWVLAVGYPLSLETTVTAGIVSAKYRNIGINQSKSGPNAVESFIQTDAAVNPGNSGGALVNAAGDLIGINSAIASPTGSYAGYSFAIPSNIVRKVVNDMVTFGNVQRAYLGITFSDSKTAGPEKLESMGLDKTDGVYVEEVMEGGAAEDAGLKKGDIITKVGEKEIHFGPQLSEAIAQYRPGDKASLTFVRSGSERTASVVFKEKTGTRNVASSFAKELLGAEFTELSKEDCRRFGVKGGVKVSAINPRGDLARGTRIKSGFIITQVNDDAVMTLEDLNRFLSSGERDYQIGGIYPNIQGVYYYTLRINN
ncbi:MAG TPA: Do family serine endopeptidase [Chitinophagaceae bacterium]|nr:Do family serine endopeptidase [Chitinophagaceae bacterium]HNF72251.1 Do family serine endopeptidase [Chitinophagaceae bacterium]